MPEIIVRFPKPLAILGLLIWLPMFVFSAVVGTLMTLNLHTLAGTFPMWALAAGYVLFPMMLAVSIAGIVAFFLYALETFFTTFRVTKNGINIENRRYGLLELAWTDIEAARHSTLLKYVVLESRKLKVPIAIMDNASMGFEEAVVQVKKNVGARWVASWLWP
jgi:hypothetical protein